MKKHIAFLMALGVVSMQAETLDYPPLELWNKTDKPLYFAIASTKSPSDDKVMSEPLVELPAGKYVTGKSDLVDKSKYTRLLITQDPDAKTVTVYTFNPNKYMWVRVKEEKGKLEFGPQTGPWLGLGFAFSGDLERGLPKKDNITSSDYKTQTLTRSLTQRAKKAAKGLVYGYEIGG